MTSDGGTSVIFDGSIDMWIPVDPVIELRGVVGWTRQWKSDEVKSLLITCDAGCVKNAGSLDRAWARRVVVEFYRGI
ncbi:hypothetical protein [uncultured Corynebacterium sp.]|uniref:hypothetical protein n=1 Tax=uncultured Corynebacterium sp. TaxID=159447 RepID=UPI0025D4C850|nr:hypothetical protein [uncultured Corynebacterium sp.]